MTVGKENLVGMVIRRHCFSSKMLYFLFSIIASEKDTSTPILQGYFEKKKLLLFRVSSGSSGGK